MRSDPPKIIIEASVLGLATLYETARTGIHRVISSVIPELLPLDERLRVTSLSSTEINLLSRQAIEKLGHGKRFLPGSRGLENTLFRLVRSLGPLDPGKIGRRLVARLFRRANTRYILDQCDIFHSTFLPLPRADGRVLRFLTIYDLIPIIHPEYFWNNFDAEFNRIIRSVHPEKDWILTISQSSKEDICTHLSMAPERVFVASPAASPSLYSPVSDENRIDQVLARYHIPRRGYFLSLATLEYRKNLATTIAAFRQFLREPGHGEALLVLTGTRGWKVEQLLNEIREDPLLRKRVILTGYVADQDLSSLYCGGLAFVYPSLYEGFGLPVLEAMQCGLPVITSTASSLPEVAGNAAILVEPADTDGLTQAMLTLAGDRELRLQMRERGLQQAQGFSWQHCADKTMLAYHTAWEGR